MPSYFIGIDSGTQSTKAVVVHAGNGKVVGTASKTYELISGLPQGHKEQHPKQWIDAVKFTICAAVKNAKINPQQVIGIGVSGQQHGFVPLDAQGRVIRPAKLWCDISTSAQCEQMIRKMGGLKKTIQLIGNGIPAGFTASKILWLKQNEPKNYKRLATVLLPHDYINFWLTGRKAMEFGDASGTALFDVRTRRWRKELINLIGSDLNAKLPEVQSSTQPVGRLSSKTAKELGLSEKVLVSAGGGDNMMGAIGTGNTKPGVVTASFGTSGTIYAYSQRPIVDLQGEVAAFCDSTGAWLPLVCTMNVTVATEMIRKVFSCSHDQFAKVSASAQPGSDGLLLIPYLDGERTPNVPNGTGVLFGINSKNYTSANIARAAMEGVTMGMNYGLNRLKSLGIRPKQIRVTGGGAKSKVWRQIMADVFGCEIVVTKTLEGAAYGAALQAWWCFENEKGNRLKISELTDRYVEIDRHSTAHPRSRFTKLYRSLQKIQDRAAQDLQPMFKLNKSRES
jgi:xylulokinase